MDRIWHSPPISRIARSAALVSQRALSLPTLTSLEPSHAFCCYSPYSADRLIFLHCNMSTPRRCSVHQRSGHWTPIGIRHVVEKRPWVRKGTCRPNPAAHQAAQCDQRLLKRGPGSRCGPHVCSKHHFLRLARALIVTWVARSGVSCRHCHPQARVAPLSAISGCQRRRTLPPYNGQPDNP